MFSIIVLLYSIACSSCRRREQNNERKREEQKMQQKQQPQQACRRSSHLQLSYLEETRMNRKVATHNTQIENERGTDGQTVRERKSEREREREAGKINKITFPIQ